MIPTLQVGGLGRMRKAASGPVSPYSGWSGTPVTGITYSNSNKTATRSGVTGVALVRSAKSRTSGKYYFEIQAKQNSGNHLGVGFASGTVGSFLGANTAGWGYWDGTTAATTYQNNVSTAQTASSPTMVAGVRIGIALDIGTGEGWVSRVGTFIGNPAAGTGESFTFTPGTAVYPAADPEVAGAIATLYTDPAEHLYSAPAGFTAGWAD